MGNGRQPPYRYTICKTENGAIVDKTEEVLVFLELSDALPRNFSQFGNMFRRRESAIRALALYWVLRAALEHKSDLCQDVVKEAYARIIDGTRYAMETDGSCYFVRPVAFDDPFLINCRISFGDKYEKLIPSLDAYLKMKH